MNFKKYMYAALCCVALGMSSCSEDTKYDFDGIAYERVFFDHANALAEGALVSTPVGYFNRLDAVVNVCRTGTPDQSLTANVTVNPALVAEYNAKNGTDYAPIPESAVTLSSQSLTIAPGRTMSEEAIHVSVAESAYTSLTAPKYLIPVVISSVSNQDYQVSSNLAVRYVALNVKEETLNKNSNQPLGKQITDYSGWSFVSGVGASASGFSNIFTTSTSQVWSWTAQEGSAIMDMGEEKNLTGFRMRTYYSNYIQGYGTAYGVYYLGCEISSDGENWTDCGILERGEYGFDSTGYQYVCFYGPMKARYLKVKLMFRSNSSTYRRIQVFQAYEE